MIGIIQEIILDYQEVQPATGVPLRVSVTPVRGKAIVCIGVRRSGKSTFMFQLMEKLLATGVDRSNILYLNFFDDRLHGLRHGNLGIILDAYFSLYPEKKGHGMIYCFLDEIQVIPEWEPFVDRLQRTERCEVYITGSSARMLSREIATQMRGRALSWEMFPFSFTEFLDARGIDSQGPMSSKKRLTIMNAFEAYRETGGFPEVIDLEPDTRRKILQEYWGAMLFRDLVERHDIAHPRAVTDLAHRLVDNTGSLYSVNSLTGYLKSLGHKAPKSAVADYLEWFEDAYILFTVRIFDASLARAHANPKKIYCVDHALINAVSSGILLNAGHLLENMVFMGLRRITPEIFYYKTRKGREVDFIARNPDRSLRLVQVCEVMADPQTRTREVTALSEAMAEMGLSEGIVVTSNENEHIEVASGTIHVVPAWRFLLES
jgi:hypothetical protein